MKEPEIKSNKAAGTNNDEPVDENLIRRDNIFRVLFELLPDAIFLADAETGNIVNANPAATKLLEKPLPEIIGMNFTEIHPADLREEAIESFNYWPAVNNSDVTPIQIEVQTAGGKRKNVEIYGRAINLNGRSYVLGNFRDITQRIQNEKALRRSEFRLREAERMAHLGHYEIDLRSKAVKWSEETFRIFEMDPEKDTPPNAVIYQEFIHPDDRDEFKSIMSDSIENKKTYNLIYRIFTKTGVMKIVHSVAHVKVNSGGESIRMFGTLQDITKQKNTEYELRESESRSRALFEYSTIPKWEEDFSGLKKYFDELRNNGVTDFRKHLTDHPADLQKCVSLVKIIDANRVSLEFFDVPNKQELDRNLSSYFTEESFDVFRDEMVAFASGETKFEGEIAIRTLSGEKKYLIIKLGVLPGYEKSLKRVLLSWLDITDRKLAEEAIRKSENEYRTLVENVPGIVYSCEVDPPWKMYQLNEGVLPVTGYSVADFIDRGMVWSDIVFPDDEEYVKEKVDEGVSNRLPYIIEYRIIHKDGNIRWVFERGKAVYDNESNPIFLTGVIMDITDRKKTEEELQKIAKLESVGILAGGIAHNIKNILTNISFNIGLARYKPEKADKYLDLIENAVGQVTSLANRFQTFTSAGDPVKEIVNIREVLTESASIALSGTKVKSSMDISDDIQDIYADARQLNEVFTNLFINSTDAMPTGGIIKVSAGNINFTNNEFGMPNGSYVKISVIDNGTGIKGEDKVKVFDPYFSTKGAHRGLGLSSAYFIIQKHMGYITVESTPGKGTAFFIYLPSSDKKKTPDDGGQKEILPGGRKRILYMDDEEALRENMEELLDMLDYDIDTVDDGYKAIEFYKKSIEDERKYDVVILDLVIQGSDLQGEGVIKQLLNLDPNVKALVFSGHSVKPIVANYRDYGFVARLEKPVSVENISHVLNKVLNNDVSTSAR